jgi:glycosyltransferase involved in cell wall biosynthesis
MATGTPVIAFARGSMPEIIVDGTTGFLVESVEAAEKALGRVSDIDRADCHAHVERRFSAERMVDDYIRVYREIVHGTPGIVSAAPR